MRSIAASRMATPPPSTWSSYGWTYRARTPTSERVSTDRRAVDGDASTSWRAHGRRPLAISNPEFCLPTMKTRLPA